MAVGRHLQEKLVVVFACVITIVFLVIPGLVVGQDSADESQANNIVQTAVNAQNAGEFGLAASQWKKLIADFPQSSLIGQAHHNLGICYVQTGDLEEATDVLKKSLSTLPKSETDKLARSYLFLGFAQARIGKDIADEAKTEEQKEESRKWFTTATQTLEQLQTRFPEFVELDQACFFQGEAYESLGRLEKAAESFERMLKLPKQAFKFDGILALANVNEQLENFDAAIKYYDLFQKEAESEGGHPLLSEARFRKAETVVEMANAAVKRGEDATSFYTSAEALYSQVAADPEFEMADTAVYRQAYCANRQRQFEKSADLYLQISARPNSNLAERSLVYAGRDYMSAGLTDKAASTLKKAVDAETKYSPEAAHWLAQMHLRGGKNQEAFDLAQTWLTKSKSDSPHYVSLLLDRADAAYLLDDRRSESPAFYLEIADQHPDHELAPAALYNASFAFLEINRFNEAITLVDRFIDQYESSEYLPDALEVKADSSLLAGSHSTAESVFRRLVQEYPENPKSSTWNLRIGLAQLMQEKYSEAIDWLGAKSSHMTEKSQLAEALHIIGTSHFELKQDEKAIENLRQSVNTDPAWRKADETLMTLSLAQERSGNSGDAEATNQQLITTLPDSPLLGKAFFRLGEMAYAKSDFETALGNYTKVISNHTESNFIPHALFGAGWSSIELKQFDQSRKYFNQLISDHPDHERAKAALIGRGISHRKSGNAEQAVADLTEFMDTDPSGKDELDALHELGLAQAELKKWDDVVSTFSKLLEKDPQSQLADKFHYELAWANKSRNDNAAALKHFDIIAKQHADSPLAPEANFHVANEAYDQQKYSEAAVAYSACLNSAGNDSLREKSAYKLAWCHYKQKDYDASWKQFKEQVEQFPDGQLKTDALLMVPDCLYRLERHEQAYEAYRVAKPVIESTQSVETRIRWQSLLHGGQSANKTGKFSEAIEFVQPIIDSEVASEDLKYDAYLEIGTAHKGLKNYDEAKKAWSKAAASISETGAEARCMIGELLFEEKKFQDAINEYKLVFYGYGGKQATKDIRPWQAFAVFEAAQCHYVQIKEADAALRTKMITEAMKLYQYLVDTYPEDRLVNESKKRIQTLKQLN